MALFACFPRHTAIIGPSLFYGSTAKRKCIFNAMLDVEEDDPLFQSALQRASLRLRETLRPEPLFVDPYIQCLSPPESRMDVSQDLHGHCLAAKFIDDKLISMMSRTDDLRQVVLLTDGMDTRPYRLNWPTSTILFDVSPKRISRRSIKKLEEVGAKIPRSCLLRHIPSETFDIQQNLHSKGFNGSRPSVWALQGLPVLNLADFEDTLGIASNLVAKGCLFLGELPVWLSESEVGSEQVDRIFMKYGLRVELQDYDEVARNLGKQESARNGCKNAVFVAEQLRFSEDQMSIWRREFQRIEEEEEDEEGFEEL